MIGRLVCVTCVAWVALGLGVPPGTAAADADERPRSGLEPTTRVGVGLVSGPQLIDTLHVFGVGPELEVGRRVGRALILGRARLMRLRLAPEGEGMDDDAAMQDIGGLLVAPGAAVRIPVAVSWLDRRGSAIGMWAEAGASWRVVRWDEGGVLRRAELSLGVGFDGVGLLGWGERPHQIAIGAGLRAVFADAAGTQHGYDPGFLIVFRVGWQR